MTIAPAIALIINISTGPGGWGRSWKGGLHKATAHEDHQTDFDSEFEFEMPEDIGRKTARYRSTKTLNAEASHRIVSSLG